MGIYLPPMLHGSTTRCNSVSNCRDEPGKKEHSLIRGTACMLMRHQRQSEIAHAVMCMHASASSCTKSRPGSQPKRVVLQCGSWQGLTVPAEI